MYKVYVVENRCCTVVVMMPLHFLLLMSGAIGVVKTLHVEFLPEIL